MTNKTKILSIVNAGDGTYLQTMVRRKPITPRIRALFNKENKYTGGRPCPTHGESVRYTINSKCIDCVAAIKKGKS